VHKLEQSGFSVVRPLFDTPLLDLVGESLIEGHTGGTVWVDRVTTPSLSVIKSGRSIFISGDPEAAETPASLGKLLKSKLADRGGTYKLLCSPDDGRWDDFRFFSSTEGTNLQRRIYTELRTPASDRDVMAPTGTQLRQIDGILLGSVRSHIDALKDEILGGWDTEEAFLRDGFGYALATDSSVLCWCTAEYRSARKCGIGIETVEGCEGRGHATAVATEFVRHAGRLGLAPYWDCWADNTPSVRVAEKVGFIGAHNYQVSLGGFDA
jgi:hypothetical protein